MKFNHVRNIKSKTFVEAHNVSRISYGMKILIGSPIHESKDYCAERWMANVAELIKVSPADILIVDNSPSPDYVDRVKGYCKKYKIQDSRFKIIHIELDPDLTPADRRSLGVETAQETIRQHVLNEGYDIWFSWESDQIIPNDALNKLLEIKERNQSMLVIHESHDRVNPKDLNLDMGVTLVTREALEKGWFLPVVNGKVSRNLKDAYDVDRVTFKKRVLQNGGNYLQVFGVIKPIYHLNR